MKARSALLKLFKESREWRDFFRSCCETSAFRLRSQERQFRKELEERGNEILADEVEDALLGLARELMPNARPRSGTRSGRTGCARTPSPAWPRPTPGCLPKSKAPWTSRPRGRSTNAYARRAGTTIRPPFGRHCGAGNEKGWRPCRARGSGEGRHEHFGWYTRHGFGQRGTGNP